MRSIGDKVDNTPGASGELTAAEYNDHKNEIQETVTSAGQTLDIGRTPDQMSRSMFIYGTASQSMVDAAPSANIIELTPITGSAGLITPDNYNQMDGMQVEFVKPVANTSSTVTVNFGQSAITLLGAKSLKQEDGSNPVLGQVQGRLKIQFDVGSDYWIIVSSSTLPTSNENDIINGMMDIWQRNTTFTTIVNGAYSADRFQYGKSGVMVHDILQSSDTPNTNFNYSLLIDCTTADTTIDASDYTEIQQKIEGYNFKKYVDNYGTLGFWVKSSKTGIHCVSFVNSGNDRSYVVEYTVNSVDTWEYKTITVLFDETGGTWDYTNGKGIKISWALAAGSNTQTTPNTWQTGNYIATSNQVNLCDSAANNFRLTGITFNLGIQPIDFSYYDIEKELARCQRYYEFSTGGKNYYNFAQSSATQLQRQNIKFSVLKRSNAALIATRTGGSAGTTVSTVSTDEESSLLSFTGNAGEYILFDWVNAQEL